MIQKFIEDYQREVDNLQFHLTTNTEFLSDADIERMETRIRDRVQFINDLERIKKVYE